ncbi:MAG: UDP-N-acetylmuramoyl-tripeptide--D-alanyl-D-alanine ligase, partial [Eubacteriales bacterium]|nr:UDP-N-acetylmuramoyl-tripeptide--D-alanyl-D-alanine ligase [Eubacteriales bacterium]
MEPICCQEVLNAVEGTLESGDINILFKGISTDSRKIKSGDLFIPLEGENHDGHSYISGAINSGAAGTLTHKNTFSKNLKGTEFLNETAVVRVADTLKALGSLAAFYRNRFNIPVIAVTGSVGKTGTKDMIAAAMSTRRNVLKTAGNYNNEIGLPLTMFNLEGSHEAAVIEMGMSGFSEIGRLSTIARPDIAVITNIGMSHIEKLGSRENIMKAKLEVLEGMDFYKGLLLLNSDDELLSGIKGSRGIRTLYFGLESDADYKAFDVEINEFNSDFSINIKGKKYRVRIPVPGIHNVYNAAAAIAAATELGIEMDGIIEGLALYNPGNMRMNIVEKTGLKVINDTYNASPDSMKAAIDVMMKIKGERRIAVLGDMLEMGIWAEKAHKGV